MLKHCSPSSVDVRRRSRRNLLLEDNYNVINNNNIDAVIDVEAMSETSSSSTSSSTSSDGSTTSCIIRTTTTATTSTSTSTSSSNTKPISLKDASTSPLISRVRLFNHNHNLDEAKIPIKVYARCLRADIEYKTLIVGSSTTSRELIWQLLSKYRMRHRDPKLFYLTMDINIKRTGIPLRRSLALDDDSRPVELQSCHPWGECKFTLQAKKGGVIRIYDSVLMAESRYKCLLVSESTTVSDVIRMLFHCYALEGVERVDRFRVIETEGEDGSAKERMLSMDERPILVQASWGANAEKMKLVLKAAVEFYRPVVHEDDDDDDVDVEDSSEGSEYSALRFSVSTRSSTTSSDSGLLTSSSAAAAANEHFNKMVRRQSQNKKTPSLSISLHSLLEALPAASVDTGLLDKSVVVSKKRASLTSSASLDSSTVSDCDSYFYI